MLLLFDIGATKTRLALSDGKTVGEPVVIPTAENIGMSIAHIRETAASLLQKGQKLTEALGGVAGALDAQKTMLAHAPNLPLWNQKPLKGELERALGVPVRLENDSALVGLGEAVYGAGRGKRIVAYITVSTGVGGARIVESRIDQNAMGFEPGHQIIAMNGGGGSACRVCGDAGCLEGLISGSSFQARFGRHPADITDEAVWRDAAHTLAVGLVNVIVHWSPDIVVLGGAMIQNKVGIPFDETALVLKQRMKIFSRLPEMRKATLGDTSGLWGALVLFGKKK